MAMSNIYGPSDETENIETIHATVYAGFPTANTGFHNPREE
jgi:hypothetical protein